MQQEFRKKVIRYFIVMTKPLPDLEEIEQKGLKIAEQEAERKNNIRSGLIKTLMYILAVLVGLFIILGILDFLEIL